MSQSSSLTSLVGVQGADEGRTEPYGQYGEGALESATPQSAKIRKRPFAVFDIDGTLIRWQLYHSIVSELGRRQLISADTVQTINEARMTWKKRSHLESFKDYEQVLVRAYEAAVQSISVDEYLGVVDQVFAVYKDQVYVYTRDLIRSLKAKDYLLFALSASQHEIVAKLADYYGFDEAIGTRYERDGNHFTGKVIGKVWGKKPELLQQLISKHDVTLAGSIGVGDSESDIGFLEMVEQPIAFNPSDKLFQTATVHGWPIVVERKNVIYELGKDNGHYLLA